MTTSRKRPIDAETDWIRVRGARVHNLQNIDVDLPQDRFVVMTGVSGSGKSSLAFDTIFAEGQRRYLESLSAHTRQFLHQIERPDVDSITGLAPTICVDQRVGSARVRSTLGTTTEIYDYLRLLYARCGQAHCPDCGQSVERQSVDTIVSHVMQLESGRKVMLLAPLVAGRKGAHREVFERIAKAGFVRARVDGAIVDMATPPDLQRSKSHSIDAIVDRIIVKTGIEARLRESIELALKHGEGTCLISEMVDGDWVDRLYSSRYACPQCGTSFPPLEPRTFSFNSPYGACTTCRGLGLIGSGERDADHDSHSSNSLHLTDEVCPDCRGARLGRFARAVTFLNQTLPHAVGQSVEDAWRYFADVLRQMGHAGQATQQRLGMSAVAAAAARSILPEIVSRLQFLERVGVGYLTLDRATRTLSGGEFQRARLASALGSALIGVCYVLDEPTIGLHPRDTARLIDVLLDLRDRGNSVLAVEHDLDVMRAADWLIDLGPGAGREGGKLVVANTPESLAGRKDTSSQTVRFLGPAAGDGNAVPGSTQVPTCHIRHPRSIDPNKNLIVEGIGIHNIHHLTAQIPLGVLLAVTGVSGSGKTSLLTHAIVPAIRFALSQRDSEQFANLRSHGQACDAVRGLEHIDRLVVVDQTPIGRSGRSNPATHTGIWNEVRRIFAKTRDAKLRGFSAKRFSFQSTEGRCPNCRGQGTRRLEMNFLPDIYVQCTVCRGARFNPQTLSVRYRQKNVADVLGLRIDAAAEFFANFHKVKSVLNLMCQVGLGYLELGQPANTLSGGEAQRIKLAAELAKGSAERVLYVLDEPTTGLHPADVERLTELLHRLVDGGHSVIVIEHNLEVIRVADWVIDMGPEGGRGGGRIVASGPPGELASQPALGHTAYALAR